MNFFLSWQGCGVGGKMFVSPAPTPNVQNFPTPTFWHTVLWTMFDKSWCTARILCFIKSFKISCTIPTARVRMPNLGVRCNKWFKWTSGVGVRWKNPTSSVLKNPTTPKTPTPCDSDSTTLLAMTHSDKLIFLLYPPRNKFWKPMCIRKLMLYPFRIHIKCNFLS